MCCAVVKEQHYMSDYPHRNRQQFHILRVVHFVFIHILICGSWAGQPLSLAALGTHAQHCAFVFIVRTLFKNVM